MTVNSAFIYDAFGVVANSTCTVGTTQVVCPVGNLGVVGGLVVDVNVTAPAAGSYTFTYTVSGNELDPNPANNVATLNVTVQTGADVAITVSASPNPVPLGSPATLTAVVSNNGPNVATAVSAFLSSPVLQTFTTTQGTCTIDTCSLGNIAPGSSVTITATATFVASNASTTGTVSLGFFVSASTADPNTGNNFFFLNLPLTNPATPQQRWMVVDRENSQIRALDFATNATIGQPTSAGVDPIGIALSPNRHTAFVANQNSSYISVVDLSIQQEIYRIRVTDQLGPTKVTVSPDGTKLLATFLTSDKLYIFDALSFNQLRSVDLDGQFGDVVGTADIGFTNMVVVGTKAYVAATFLTGDATGGLAVSTPVVAVDINTGSVSTVSGTTDYGAASSATFNGSNALAATPDGQLVIAARNNPGNCSGACGSNTVLQLISTATNTVTQSVAATVTANGMVVGSGTPSPAGTYAYVALSNRGMIVVDLRNGSPTFGQLLSGRTVTLPSSVDVLAVSPDGTRLYATTGSINATINAVVVDTSILVTGANPSASIIFQTRLGGVCSASSCPGGLRGLAAGFVDTLPEAGAPVISGVSPTFIFNNVATTITISGSGFASDARVRVGKMDGLPVTFVSSNELQVTIPAGAPAHGSDIIVTNPNATAAPAGQLLSAFLQHGSDNGGLEIASPLSYQPKFQAVVSDFGAASIDFLRQSGGGGSQIFVGPGPMGVAFSPDGSQFYVEIFSLRSVIAGSTQCCQNFQMPQNTQITLSGTPGQPDSIAVAPNPATGEPVALVSSTSTPADVQLNVIDANPSSPAVNSILFTIPAHLGSSTLPGALAARPDGRYVYQLITDGRLVIFDVVAHSATIIPAGTLNVTWYAAAVSPDGHTLLLPDGGSSGGIKVFDISANPLSPALLTTINLVAPLNSTTGYFASFRVVGNHLYAVDPGSKVVEIFNFNRATSNFSFVNYFNVPGSPPSTISYTSGIAVAPDESLIYVPIREDDIVAVIDAAKLISGGVQGDPSALVTTIATAQGPSTIALSPKRLDTAPQDVGITISHTPEPVPLGSNITFNVTLSDFGPIPGRRERQQQQLGRLQRWLPHQFRQDSDPDLHQFLQFAVRRLQAQWHAVALRLQQQRPRPRPAARFHQRYPGPADDRPRRRHCTGLH